MESSAINNHKDTALFTFFGLPLLMAPLSTAGTSIAGGIFVLLYLLSGYWRNWRLVLERPWFWPLMALIAINILGLLWTSDLDRGANLVSKLSYFFFALAGATLPWQARHLRILLGLLLSGLVLNAMVGLLQALHLFPWRPMAEYGPVGYAGPTYLSLILAAALLWITYDFKQRVFLPRLANILLFLILFAQLAATGGRSGQLAFILCFPVALWMLYAGSWRKWALGAAALSIIALAASPMAQQRALQVQQNIEQYQAGNTTTSIGLRLVFWDGALHMIMEHPVLGVGTGDYVDEMARLQARHEIPATPGASRNDNPHNNYLAYWADLGIVGLAVLLWFYFAMFAEAWRPRMQAAGWLKLSWLSVFFVGCLTDTLLWGQDNMYTLSILAAIPASLALAARAPARAAPE